MRLALSLVLVLASTSCGGGGYGDGDGDGDGDGGAAKGVVWPISGSSQPDADTVSAPFGPRDQSGDYDFHAGIDLPIPEGTPIHAIKAGEVEKIEAWDGDTGPGNWVLIDHGDGEKSAYLHFSETSVQAGDIVNAGAVLGRSGSTGAKSPHLHLTYMRDVYSNGADEDLAHNVLKILPHTAMPALVVEFTDLAVALDVPIYPMTIQSITVAGEGGSRTIDYAEIVALGNPDRDDQDQSGLEIEVTDIDDTLFRLTLGVDPPDFAPTQVILTDIDGGQLMFERAP
jgi:murein DD-endopeptidase MepM/ murein hydrolase activator NlpD